jgi:hypothetical protein
MFVDDSESVPFPVIHFLENLREACLTRSTTHLPICRFRAADGFVFQLQPRPVVETWPTVSAGAGILRLFRGIAVTVDKDLASAPMLTCSRFDFPDDVLWRRRHFEVVERDGDRTHWHLVRRGCDHARWAGDCLSVLDRRLAKVFVGKFFSELEPGALLSNHCLICGTPLSDPASMARFVGPECAATTSNIVPFMLTKRRRRS